MMPGETKGEAGSMKVNEIEVPEDLASFVEAEAANALNVPAGRVDALADPALARIGLARVIGALVHGGSVPRAVREAGCFEGWLQEQRQRDDVTGKVARWVTQEILSGRWQSEPILMGRFGHTCDTLAHHERRLKSSGLPEASVEAFFGVYDEYLTCALSSYNEKVQANTEKRTSMKKQELNQELNQELRKQDKADIERWKSPGGWLWLEERGYYDEPPNPALLVALERGDHDEDLGPVEARELAADLRERLEAYPRLMRGENSDGAQPPF